MTHSGLRGKIIALLSNNPSAVRVRIDNCVNPVSSDGAFQLPVTDLTTETTETTATTDLPDLMAELIQAARRKGLHCTITFTGEDG